MVPAENGEDEIVHCDSCGYAANTERAETGRPAPEIATPAEMTERALVDTPEAGSIEQVSRMLGCEPSRMIKTLIYSVDDKPVAVLVRGDHEANEAKIRRAIGAGARSPARAPRTAPGASPPLRNSPRPGPRRWACRGTRPAGRSGGTALDR